MKLEEFIKFLRQFHHLKWLGYTQPNHLQNPKTFVHTLVEMEEYLTNSKQNSISQTEISLASSILENNPNLTPTPPPPKLPHNPLQHSLLPNQPPTPHIKNNPNPAENHPPLPHNSLPLLAKKGGMGIVYFCYNLSKQKPFILKTFQNQIWYNSPALIKKFLTECHLWLNLPPHPSIVQAYNIQLLGNKPYLFLEFFPGISLQDQPTPLPPHQIIQIAYQIAQALHFLHKKNYLHQDIKPSNILFNQNQAKITDLGLTCLQNQLTTNLANFYQGKIHGTPLYMAPEQWDQTQLGKYTDIYSFGATLFYLVAGHPPFQTNDAFQLYQMHKTSPPTFPQKKHILTYPQEFLNLILQCLQKSPSQRPTSFQYISKKLKKILQQLPNHPSTPKSFHFPQVLWPLRKYSSQRQLKKTLKLMLNNLSQKEFFQPIDLFTLSQLSLYQYEQKLHPTTHNFSKVDLQKIYPLLPQGHFPHIYLPYANLKEANLSNANLENANLSNANLENANLSNANLENANLENANLSNANLENANLALCDLANTFMQNANVGAGVRFRLNQLPELLSLTTLEKGTWQLLVILSHWLEKGKHQKCKTTLTRLRKIQAVSALPSLVKFLELSPNSLKKDLLKLIEYLLLTGLQQKETYLQQGSSHQKRKILETTLRITFTHLIAQKHLETNLAQKKQEILNKTFSLQIQLWLQKDYQNLNEVQKEMLLQALSHPNIHLQQKVYSYLENINSPQIQQALNLHRLRLKRNKNGA